MDRGEIWSYSVKLEVSSTLINGIGNPYRTLISRELKLGKQKSNELGISLEIKGDTVIHNHFGRNFKKTLEKKEKNS